MKGLAMSSKRSHKKVVKSVESAAPVTSESSSVTIQRRSFTKAEGLERTKALIQAWNTSETKEEALSKLEGFTMEELTNKAAHLRSQGIPLKQMRKGSGYLKRNLSSLKELAASFLTQPTPSE